MCHYPNHTIKDVTEVTMQKGIVDGIKDMRIRLSVDILDTLQKVEDTKKYLIIGTLSHELPLLMEVAVSCFAVPCVTFLVVLIDKKYED